MRDEDISYQSIAPDPRTKEGDAHAGTRVTPAPGLEVLGGITQATKHDGDKPRMALIPVRAKREVAKVFTAGAVKYKAGNWHNGKGFDYDRPLSAAERHIDDFKLGKRYDTGIGGTNTHILANAICELMFVLEFELSKHGVDNRTEIQYIPNGVEALRDGE